MWFQTQLSIKWTQAQTVAAILKPGLLSQHQSALASDPSRRLNYSLEETRVMI